VLDHLVEKNRRKALAPAGAVHAQVDQRQRVVVARLGEKGGGDRALVLGD
jgi:hypothetical protein